MSGEGDRARSDSPEAGAPAPHDSDDRRSGRRDRGHRGASPRPGRGLRAIHRRRRLRRIVAITLVCVAAVCAVVAALSWFQGPKLSDTRFDVDRLVAADDQQVRFFANEPVAQVSADQVVVTPESAVSVETVGDVISVQFEDRLDSGVDYTVTVTGVTGLNQGGSSVFEVSFSTGPAEFTYLDRADPADLDGADEIIRVGVGGADGEVLHTAEGIQSYAVLDHVLAVATVDAEGASVLTIVDTIDGTTARPILPQGAVIDRLAASVSLGVVGFTMSTPAGEGSYTDALFRVDVAGEQVVEPVLDLDGTPVVTTSWFYLLDGETMAVHTAGEDVLLVDVTGAAPTLTLGSYVGLDSASPDGSILVVSDEFGSLALSVSDRSERRLEAAPVEGAQPFGGELDLLDDNLTRVQRVAVFTESTGRFASYVVADSGSESRILYESPDGRSSVEEFSVSPNGQYVAITVVPDVATSEPDGDPLAPMSTSVTTRVVDVATGAVLGTVDGFAISW